MKLQILRPEPALPREKCYDSVAFGMHVQQKLSRAEKSGLQQYGLPSTAKIPNKLATKPLPEETQMALRTVDVKLEEDVLELERLLVAMNCNTGGLQHWKVQRDVLEESRRCRKTWSAFVRRASTLRGTAAFQEFLGWDANAIPYYEIARTTQLHEFTQFLETQLYRIFGQLFPFSPQALLSHLHNFPHAQNFLLSFIALRLPEFSEIDLAEVEPLWQVKIYRRHFILSDAVGPSVCILPKDGRVIGMIQALIETSGGKTQDILAQLTAGLSSIPVRTINEAFAWLSLISAYQDAQERPAKRQRRSGGGACESDMHWSPTSGNFIRHLRRESLRVVGQRLSELKVADWEKGLSSETLSILILRDDELAVKSEDLVADFVFRLILDKLCWLLLATETTSLSAIRHICSRYLESVRWKFVPASVKRSFRQNLKLLSAKLSDSIASGLNERVASAMEFLSSMLSLLDKFVMASRLAKPTEEHIAYWHRPRTFGPSAIGNAFSQTAVRRFPKDSSWEIDGHPLSHCLEVTAGEPVLKHNPPKLGGTLSHPSGDVEEASYVDVYMRRPRDVPVQVRGNAATAVFPGERKMFDVEFLWKRTRCCVGSHPLVGVVSRQGILPRDAGTTQNSGQQLGWAADLESTTICFVESLQLSNAEAATSHSMRQRRRGVSGGQGHYKALSMVSPTRIIIDRINNRFLLLCPNTGDFYEDHIPELETLAGPVFPAVSLSSGGFRGFFNVSHPGFSAADDILHDYFASLSSTASSSSSSFLPSSYQSLRKTPGLLTVSSGFPFKSPILHCLFPAPKPDHRNVFHPQRRRRCSSKAVFSDTSSLRTDVGFHSASKSMWRSVRLSAGVPRRYPLLRRVVVAPRAFMDAAYVSPVSSTVATSSPDSPLSPTWDVISETARDLLCRDASSCKLGHKAAGGLAPPLRRSRQPPPSSSEYVPPLSKRSRAK